MVGSIIRSLDGQLAPIGCASRAFFRRCEDCPLDRPCAVQRIMEEVRDAIAAVLDARSLTQLRQLAEAREEPLLQDS